MGSSSCCQSKGLVLLFLLLNKLQMGYCVINDTYKKSQGVRDAAVDLLHTLVAVHAEVRYEHSRVYLFIFKFLLPRESFTRTIYFVKVMCIHLRRCSQRWAHLETLR